ncbi:cytochrome P450 family protein [Salinactinospora qingdaonensis]|uniref:Cytochrome P450 n=1 Tax=Salinactinospora qingdaonensis TaxID=702744 RepID=A0ABP7GJH7_9ACTN
MTDDQPDTAPTCPLEANAVPIHGSGPNVDRHALWEQLRSRFGQVAPVRLSSDLAVWLVLGYEENLEVMRDWSTYSRDTRLWKDIREGRRQLNGELRPTMSYRASALYADGAEHARLIAPINDALARLSETRIHDDIVETSDLLIDAFCAAGRADLIGDYAALLPALLMNRFFGLADTYGYALSHLSKTMWNPDPALASDAATQMGNYFLGLVQRKKAEPGADLTSWMIEHETGMTDSELVDQLILLSGAGHEPTTNLLGNVLWTLLVDSEVAREYSSGGVLLEEIINHVVWTEPPVQALAGRFPTRDVTLAHTRIGAGEPLVMGFAAAHADPRLAGASDSHAAGSSLPAGHNSAHLIWGAGEHRCPARSLAMQIVSVGVNRLLDRIHNLQLGVPPAELRWREEIFMRALAELPVTFTPVAAPERSRFPVALTPSTAASDDTADEPSDLLSRVLRWWRARASS